jgi:hypothetical protein
MTSPEPWHELHFFSNQFTRIPNETFHGLHGIELLNFKSGQLRILSRYALNGLFNLTELDFSRNRLYKIEPGAFLDTSLTRLILDFNSLYDAGISLDGLPQMQHLSIRNNYLSQLPDAELTNLRSLTAAGNRITSLSDKLQNFLNLEELDLSSNRLTSIGNNTFRNLTKVKVIKLAENRIISISELAFDGAVSLSCV